MKAGWLSAILKFPGPRPLKGRANVVFLVVAFVLPLWVLYNAGPPFLGVMGTGISRGIFMIIVFTLVLMKYPFRRGSPQHTVPWYDWTLIVLSSASFAYWTYEFDDIVWRAGAPNQLDTLFGSIVVVISVEVARRALGWALAGVAILALIYGFIGQWFPIEEFRHQGFSWTSIVDYAFSLSGMFGWLLRICMMYVVMFVLIGALLRAFGAGVFFIELPYALLGRLRGGPAIGAVGASTFMGMISGSATANVAATGAFTIPLMKKTGYPPEVAGAIEPAASVGGMFMPPIMGAGIFLMAEITGTPYIHLCVIGLVPALTYFFSVAMFCYAEAGRVGIRSLLPSECPPLLPILKRAWFYAVPLIILVIFLLQGYTPPRAAWICIVSTIAINILERLIVYFWQRFKLKEQRTSFPQLSQRIGRDFVKGLREGAEGSIMVGGIIGAIGIVISIIFLTGIGFMFTSQILELTGGLIPLAILIGLIVAYVLGMGMTVTTTYILLAVLFAPAMAVMGVYLLAAHFLLFWYSQTSNISPPVAIAAYVGASIAGADPIRTAFNCFRYAGFLFIYPILFIYSPILMQHGFNLEVLMVMVSCFLATIPFAGAVSGHLIRKCTPLERIVFALAALGLLIPVWYTSLVGLILTIILLLVQARTRPKELVAV